MVIVPDEVPVVKIDLPKTETTETGEEPAPPKSADEQAWIKALEKDTLEGYREYLEAFPNGRYAEKAQEEIDAYDNKAWATAEQRNTIAGYQDYLDAWPEGLHASKARERMAEMKARAEAIAKDARERAAQETADWEQAARENTVPAYEKYLAKHPAGKHASEAQERINALNASAADNAAWQQAKTANRVDAYEQYMTSYPQGAYVPQAMAAIENLRPAPGKTFSDCDVCPLMVSVPSGSAELGAGANEPDARPNEKPKRPVTLNNMFAMSVTEVTFAQWEACVAGGGCNARPKDNGWGGGRRPVINVSWDDAQKYTTWLSSKSGQSYSLPSEAQWEYAARGGDSGLFAGGSAKALCAFANGAGTESGLAWANKACTDPAADRTLPTGTLGANKFGLKDMIGNVAEWTMDCNTLNLRDAPVDGSPDLRGSCNQRVVRGGSWFSGPADLRFSARLMQRRGDSNDFTGFRVIRKISG
jgi:formylglycine-generating enzyme required for sulfatase activity